MFNASLLAVTTSQVAAAAATAAATLEEEEEALEEALAEQEWLQQQGGGGSHDGAAAGALLPPARASSLPAAASRRASLEGPHPQRRASLEVLSRRGSVESLQSQPALLSVGTHSAVAVVPLDENHQPIPLAGSARQRSRNLGRAASLEASGLGPDVVVVLDEIVATTSETASPTKRAASGARGGEGDGPAAERGGGPQAATTAYVMLEGAPGKGGKPEEGKGALVPVEEEAAPKRGGLGGCCARLVRRREVPGGELGQQLIGVAASSALALAIAFGLFQVGGRGGG
jgi:hypothetical protein